MEPDAGNLIRGGAAPGFGQVAGVDAAWRVEVRARLADVRTGSARLVDADEHYARLRAELTKGGRDGNAL